MVSVAASQGISFLQHYLEVFSRYKMEEDQSSNSSQSGFSDSSNEDHGDFGNEDRLGDVGESTEDLAPDLAGQSFEEILALKERVGLRTYKTAIGLEKLRSNKKRKRVGYDL